MKRLVFLSLALALMLITLSAESVFASSQDTFGPGDFASSLAQTDETNLGPNVWVASCDLGTQQTVETLNQMANVAAINRFKTTRQLKPVTYAGQQFFKDAENRKMFTPVPMAPQPDVAFFKARKLANHLPKVLPNQAFVAGRPGKTYFAEMTGLDQVSAGIFSYKDVAVPKDRVRTEVNGYGYRANTSSAGANATFNPFYSYRGLKS